MRLPTLAAAAGSTLLAAVLLVTPSDVEAQGASASGSWKALFDGNTLAGWRGYQSQTVPSGWHVMDGTLTKMAPTGDIITTEKFANFELELEWKLAPRGNAGIFYRGSEELPKVYLTAPEYQLLDDAAAPDGKDRLTSAGAAYALYPAPAGVVKAAGEWNSARIVVNGAHVEHWMNAQKLLEYELWSSDWEAKVKASKFREFPKYGREKTGHIAIQGDHEGMLALRNIRIKVLP